MGAVKGVQFPTEFTDDDQSLHRWWGNCSINARVNKDQILICNITPQIDHITLPRFTLGKVMSDSFTNLALTQIERFTKDDLFDKLTELIAEQAISINTHVAGTCELKHDRY